MRLPKAPAGAWRRCDGTIEVSVGVAVVGNGPAGLAMSYMLSGNLPFYAAKDSDPPRGIPRWLHRRLASLDGSLALSDDLASLSEGLEGRSDSPVSLLLDTLQHPQTDAGARLPTLLSWRRVPERAVSHVVLGRGPPGGVWATMQPTSRTLSYASWMDLPGYSLREWAREHGHDEALDSDDRVSLGTVAAYFAAYPAAVGIQPHMLSSATIERATRTDGGHWELTGHVHVRKGVRVPLRVQAASLVVAGGVFDTPRTISFDASDDEATSAVTHAYAHVRPDDDTVVVVGGGLSAADAVLGLLERGVRVMHVFRGPAGVIDRLPLADYPEYARLAAWMRGTQGAPAGYLPLPDCRVERLVRRHDCADGVLVHFVDKNGAMRAEAADRVLVLVGSEANLSYLPADVTAALPSAPRAHRPAPIDRFTGRWPGERNLFAVGSVAGGLFVRFLAGTCLAALSTLHSDKSLVTPPVCRCCTASLVATVSRCVPWRTDPACVMG